MYNSKNPKPLTLGEDREEWLEKILQTTANNGVVGPCPVPRSWAWPMGQDQGHPSNVALWGELARPTQPWWQLGLRPLLRNTHPHSSLHSLQTSSRSHLSTHSYGRSTQSALRNELNLSHCGVHSLCKRLV